jgi:hypothetical protein
VIIVNENSGCVDSKKLAKRGRQPSKWFAAFLTGYKNIPQPHDIHPTDGCRLQPQLGGWLASETFEYLLGCNELDGDARTLLGDSKRKGGGFEDALADLQNEYARSANAHTKGESTSCNPR